MPLPPEEKVSSPGFAFAAAITSAGVFAGFDGFRIITLETPPTKATGAKSLSES